MIINAILLFILQFAYKGTLSYSKLFTGSDRDFGVGHIDDLIYLFKSPALFREFAKSSDSAQMIQSLVSTFVEFAKHGYAFAQFSYISHMHTRTSQIRCARFLIFSTPPSLC